MNQRTFSKLYGSLLACGNFSIFSAISNGEVLYVQVHSNGGGTTATGQSVAGYKRPCEHRRRPFSSGPRHGLTLLSTVAETLLLTPAAE
jgi:hypothetical protein